MPKKLKVNVGKKKQFDEDKFDDLQIEVMVLISKGNYGGALSCCEQLLTMKPDFFDIMLKKGYLLSRLGCSKEAMECFNELLIGVPTDSLIYMHLAFCNYETGNIDATLKYFDKAIELEPDALYWELKGVCLKGFGDNDKALFCYDKALKLKPDYEAVWLQKGFLLAEMDRQKEADECIAQFLKIIKQNSSPVKFWEFILNR